MTALIDAGATIQEINTIRKHLSYARGGNLAKDAYPARVYRSSFPMWWETTWNSLLPATVKDVTTMDDAAAVLAKFNVLKTCGLEKCGLIETQRKINTSSVFQTCLWYRIITRSRR